jgi:antagonist of KipI
MAAGEVLCIGKTPSRMRAYFCVRGGLQGDVFLGSVSSLEPLVAGTSLDCPPSRCVARRVIDDWEWDCEPSVLRILLSMLAGDDDVAILLGHGFRVEASSNRMALRLDGPRLPPTPSAFLSEPVCPGTIQVTGDGRLMVLGVDAQTIGGYKGIAHVIQADIDKLGQMRPGESVRFRRVSMEEAERIHVRKADESRRLWLRLIGAAKIADRPSPGWERTSL